MRKLFAVLFCTLVMSASSFADELSYEIDPVATANAPWKVGQRIIEKTICNRRSGYSYREFLGVTQSGLALVQDFYLSGEKLTDPFQMGIESAGVPCKIDTEGAYIMWYKNGQKRSEGIYINRKIEGHMIGWYEDGEKRFEGNVKSGKWVGIMRAWDEKANLIIEYDYGTPED